MSPEMSQYQKPCIFCKQEIKMSDSSGKWLPYNLDGSLHECRENNNNNKKIVTSAKSKSVAVTATKLTLEDLNKRLKKIEDLLYMDI
jgi:hypothetical protein